MGLRLFAVASSLAVLAVLAAFAAFLQNWIPKGIDTGMPPIEGGIVFNLLLLAFFGIVHSALARPAVKRRLYGANAAWSRPVYIAVSALQLGALLVLWTPMPGVVWHFSTPAAVGVFLALYGASLLLVAWAIFSIDALHFFGLRTAEPPFALKGPYRYVRHPIQTGLIVALWSAPHMSVGHALMAAVLTAYSVLATLRLEEHDLEAALGESYRAYRRDVPALLPRLWRRR
ncbi:methyltransferase family protein [Massilia endophytica]|uniref:methyltransferase family protein n=1 Tax=Massilia endophytica TaxID=2899220 RepID=UPI001E51E901|nr:isoprenylcysteine carboxylmethyltransferase family protein [Massilia endophytica]UGQ45283.1 isoprenylcysteine carboxylmethyltransferase family protein [Massilia endophytica]